MAPTKQWEAKVKAKVEKASADQVFGFVKDFVGFHKWFPGIASCTLTGGVNGQPGCTRYCVFEIPEWDNSGGPNKYVNETILAVDDEERLLSYKAEENNLGYESSVSTIKIVPEGDGCVIEWGFSVDPVEGWTLEDLVGLIYESGLQGMAKKMEEAVTS